MKHDRGSGSTICHSHLRSSRCRNVQSGLLPGGYGSTKYRLFWSLALTPLKCNFHLGSDLFYRTWVCFNKQGTINHATSLWRKFRIWREKLLLYNAVMLRLIIWLLILRDHFSHFMERKGINKLMWGRFILVRHLCLFFLCYIVSNTFKDNIRRWKLTLTV